MNSSPEPSPSDSDIDLSGSTSSDPRQPLNGEQDFEQALLEVESYLHELKERYSQIQRDRSRQTELQQRQKQLKKELRQTPHGQLKEELRQIHEELETLELNLESSLFSIGSLKEPFWQAVRFAGLGIVVGWILKSCAG